MTHGVFASLSNSPLNASCSRVQTQLITNALGNSATNDPYLQGAVSQESTDLAGVLLKAAKLARAIRVWIPVGRPRPFIAVASSLLRHLLAARLHQLTSTNCRTSQD